MKDAPTPETDAHEYHFENHDPSAGESLIRRHDGRDVAWDDGYDGTAVPATLARKLERERDALRRAMTAEFLYRALRPNCSWEINADQDRWEREAQKLRDAIERAKVAACAPPEERDV